ncbi:MAG: proteinase inhibitor I4 serpin [Saprospiraceae bacterium]|nr:BPTI/Kunitz domain-containing protein [Bacteroidia bacterium]NNE14065.1 proteinase inhibitor I4 serpin [Saprospiraceae bacterium]NNL92864.1 proteinase inhibitor I4 serpin [Saprospiraceae bacterium]
MVYLSKNLKYAFFILCLFVVNINCSDEEEVVNACPSCELEPMVGPCNAAFPKYYFDKEEKKCKQFTWGGCAGVVPFDTLEECELCDCQ